MKDISIRTIMTANVITVLEHDTVAKVAEIFGKKTFHHIPVTGADGSLKGIISIGDFERIKAGSTLFRNPKIDAYNEALFESLLAQDIMTRDVVELQADDTMYNAYAIFKKNKYRALPIVEKGMLVGILTPFDLLDYCFNQNQ